MRWHPIGRSGWLLRKTNSILIWCVSSSLGSWMICWPEFLYVRYRLQRNDHVIIILWVDAQLVAWDVAGIFIMMCSEPSVLDVNIIWYTTLWSDLHKICTIWGYCAFPHEWYCCKLIIKHYIKLRRDMASLWFYNQSYWSWMKWWFNKIYPYTLVRFPLWHSRYIDLQYCIKETNWT